MTQHIMVVEDDASLAEGLFDVLTHNKYLVTICNRGDQAIELIQADQPDLVLLDIGLPGKDGFEVCQAVRKFYQKPILMLTARTEENDELQGFDVGADEYVVKPFKLKILLARIKLLLERTSAIATSDMRAIGQLSVDATNRTVKLNEEVVDLADTEFNLLWRLMESPGKVVNREDLLWDLCNLDDDGFNRTVDINISRLRKKFSDTSQRRIKTVRGVGYLLATDAW